MNATNDALEWPCLASEYHADPRLSGSKLCDFMGSRADYYEKHHTGNLVEKPKVVYAFGTAVHAMVLEPDLPFVMAPEARKNSVAWKAERVNADELIALHKEQGRDHIEIKKDDFENARACANAVLEHEDYQELAELTPQVEFSMTYTEPTTLFAVKHRMDRVCLDQRPMIMDLKTSRDPKPRAFGSDAGKLRYHNKMAFYQYGLSILLGIPRDEIEVYVFAVRSKFPYQCGGYELKEEDLETAHRQNMFALAELQDCISLASDPDNNPRKVFRDDWCVGTNILEIPEWYLR